MSPLPTGHLVRTGLRSHEAFGFEPIEGDVNGAARHLTSRPPFNFAADRGYQGGAVEAQDGEKDENFEFSECRSDAYNVGTELRAMSTVLAAQARRAGKAEKAARFSCEDKFVTLIRRQPLADEAEDRDTEIIRTRPTGPTCPTRQTPLLLCRAQRENSPSCRCDQTRTAT